jgi:hypothetical protein
MMPKAGGLDLNLILYVTFRPPLKPKPKPYLT